MQTKQAFSDQERQKLLDRASGCLLGLAVGDAFGDIGRNHEYRQRYGIVTRLYEGARSTDDTEFAVLTAQTLIDCGGDLTLDAVLTAWKKYILGQGGMFDRGGKPLYGAVSNIQRGILPPLSGMDNVQNDDDGAAMRIAPIGIVCTGDPERAMAMAEIESQVSHSRDGIWSAQAVAASIAVAMDGGSVDEIIEAGRRAIPDDSWLGRAMDRAMKICDENPDLMDAFHPLHEDLWTPVHSMAAEAVPQAYAVFRLTNGDFKTGMIWAGNFGRDGDTISALVGAMAGAIHGAKVIPAEWVEKVDQPAGVCLKFAAEKSMQGLAAELVDLIN